MALPAIVRKLEPTSGVFVSRPDAKVANTTEPYEPPPMRDRLPTMVFDLSEYARIHTGPLSWSARADHVLEDVTSDVIDAIFDAVQAGPLLGICKEDVPRLAVCVTDPRETGLTEIERDVIDLIDGGSDVEALLARTHASEADVLQALCDLCARGMVRLRG